MASKIQSHNFYVAITPYKVEDSSADEFNLLNVRTAYDDCRKYFYVDLHAGWNTGWGGFGCILMGADDPLTAPKYVKVKDAPKNSQKTINEMGENLKQAKDAIAWLFDKRDWKRLYTTVYKVAIDGYTEQYRKEMDELMAPAKEEPKSEDSPMMKQYRDLKSKHPAAVLLFRCGDFYETYEDDAKVCSDILGITLTKSTTTGVRMAGFPHHALDTYLPKLIRAGKRVAICDQLEDPKLTKKLVKRGITELVSPATNNESNNQEDNTMRLNINNQNESKNVQAAAQVNNSKSEAIVSQVDVIGLMNGLKKNGTAKLSDYATPIEDAQAEEIESLAVGEVTIDTIMPKMTAPVEEPKESEERSVKSEKSATADEKPAVTTPLGSHGTLVIGGVPKRKTTKSGKPSDRFDLEKPAKPKVTLKRKQPEDVSPQTSKLSVVRLVTFTTKRGDTAPRIIGFTGEDDPRWKPVYDEKQMLVKAYNEAKKKDDKAKMTSSPFGPAWLTDRETGEKSYCMTFGVRYMDVAKALCEAYNTDDRMAWHKAEQAVKDCKAGIVSGYQAEKAARKAEREARRSEEGRVKSEEFATAAPAMSDEEKAMFQMFKKFMAGDPAAIAAMNAAMAKVA